MPEGPKGEKRGPASVIAGDTVEGAGTRLRGEVDDFCDICGEGVQRVPGGDVCVEITGSVTATVGVSSGSKSEKPSH